MEEASLCEEATVTGNVLSVLPGISTEWGGSGQREGEDNLASLHGPLCLGMHISASSPAAELQHLMYVETLTCKCGNLEFSPTSYFHLLSGELWEHQGLDHPNLLSRRNQVITACRYMCCAFIGEGTQNASLTWIPVTTGMEPDEINPLPVIPFTKYPSHGCSQHHWFQREGARHLPKGRFLPVSVWGESVQPA